MLARLLTVFVLAGIIGGGIFATQHLPPTGLSDNSVEDRVVAKARQQPLVSARRSNRIAVQNASDQNVIADAPAEFKPQQRAKAIPDPETAAVLRKYLPNASAAERQIWLDQFEGLAPHEIEFIFQQRTPLPSSLTGDVDTLLQPVKQNSPDKLPSIPDKFAEPATMSNSRRQAIQENAANANTIGYCRWEVEIHPMGEQQFRLDTTCGELVKTDQSLDLAASEFFRVRVGTDDYYTRNGCFKFQAGKIVTRFAINGEHAVLLDGLPQQVTAIEIADNGEVKVAQPGEPLKRFGKIEVFDFMNPADLQRLDAVSCVYKASEAAGIPHLSETPVIEQGYLMHSNSKPNEAAMAQGPASGQNSKRRRADAIIQTGMPTIGHSPIAR